MPIGTRQRARNRALLVAALLCWALPGAAAESGSLHRIVAEEPHLGVIVRIEAYVPHDINPALLFRTAFDRVATLERKFSSYRDDSEVRRVEELAWRRPMPVSAEFSTLLAHALDVASKTGGAFDPTVGRVTRLLREQGAPRTRSARLALAEAREFTGWWRVVLDDGERTVFLCRRGVQLDFGGIAKGYIADEALRVLSRMGAGRAIVSVAGDIAVGHPPPGQSGWQVALDAVGVRDGIERRLVLRNQAVSTSGSRERFYEIDGKRCSHILSQFQDHCTDTSLAVSVVAPTGLEADALATALVAMGPKAAEDLLQGRTDVRAYWATAAATTTLAERPSSSLP